MEQKRYRHVLSYFQITIPQIFQSIESERKFELSILNEMRQHVFRSGVRSYIFTFLGYVPGLYIFLLVCGNYPLNSKRGSCRDLLSIDSRLKRINPSTNISRTIQNGDTEPNSKYSLKKYFQIVQSKSLTLFRLFDCNCILGLQFQSLSYTLAPIYQTSSTRITC